MTEAEHPRRGTLWRVSLGPGAPGLITRAAWAALQRRDTVWVYPARSGKTPSYALDIVTRAGLVPPADHAQLLFPMTHDGEKLARAWLKAAHTVLPWLQAGRDVPSSVLFFGIFCLARFSLIKKWYSRFKT